MTAPTTDSYRRIEKEARAALKIEKSEFIGIAFPIEAEPAYVAGLRRLEERSRQLR